jgi:hypothetical protein
MNVADDDEDDDVADDVRGSVGSIVLASLEDPPPVDSCVFSAVTGLCGDTCVCMMASLACSLSISVRIRSASLFLSHDSFVVRNNLVGTNLMGRLSIRIPFSHCSSHDCDCAADVNMPLPFFLPSNHVPLNTSPLL